jgi:methylated-DNA-protein-cysteine methyltransferase related protein
VPERARVAALYRTIYAVIRRIPKGRVATYGQIAELAGIPGGARISAAALKVSAGQVPWQRVCGKAGRARARIAILDPMGAATQRALLEAEGVAVGDRGLIDLGVYGWLPASAPKARAKARPQLRGSRGRAAPPRRRPRSGSTTRASPSRR